MEQLAVKEDVKCVTCDRLFQSDSYKTGTSHLLKQKRSSFELGLHVNLCLLLLGYHVLYPTIITFISSRIAFLK